MADFDAVLSTHIAETLEISPGISAKVLRFGADGSPIALEVKFAPGATWPDLDVHSHSAEAIYVVSGVLRTGIQDSGIGRTEDGRNDACPTGTFVCAEQGTSHVPYSDTGCTLIVTYPDSWTGSMPAAA